MPDRQPLYSVSAAARYLRRTRRTVERLASAGVLRPVPVVTDTAAQRAPRLFARADLDRVLSERGTANDGRDLPEPTTKDADDHHTEPPAAACTDTTAERNAG